MRLNIYELLNLPHCISWRSRPQMTVMTMVAREVTLCQVLNSRETRINPGYQRNGSNVKVGKLGFFIIALFLVFIA